jgi:diguanylate cyclase (GGDEF)-like protein
VILLDVNMPDMNGFELAQLLSCSEETRHTPIIFVTAIHFDEASLLKGYDSGGVDYIQKPVLPKILLAKIKVFLDLWLLKAGLENEILMRQAAEQKVKYFAQHDALTHLPNRRQIQSELQSIISNAKRQENQFALLFLDLDGFKKVNDEMGHEVGDALLVEMANRYKKVVRATDLVGRFGGDEFILVLTELNDPLLLKNKLQQLLAESVHSFFYHDRIIHISASIGVALYPEHGVTHDVLINNADSAMYLSKDIGKNTFQFYSAELNQQMERTLLIEQHLRGAISSHELEVYYQPIMDLSSQRVVGAEALLRWQNGFLGIVHPEEFIPVAETTGLITEIGLWVLQQVVHFMKTFPELHCAVNASSLQFNNNQLCNAIEHHIQQGKVIPENLEIEITEGVLLDRTGRAEEQLQRIHHLGVSLSVDDFGTGYSSLSYLKNCPVPTVKIDRSFVSDIPMIKTI